MPGQGGDVDGDAVHHHPAPVRRQRHDRPDVVAESAAAGIVVRPHRDAAEGRRPEYRPEVDDAQAIALADQQPAARHSFERLPVLDLPAVQRPDRESAPPCRSGSRPGPTRRRLDQAGSSKRVTSRRVARSTTWTVIGWLSLRAACSHATYRIEGSVAAPPIKACPIPNRRPAEPQQIEIRDDVLVAVAAGLGRRHQRRGEATWSTRPAVQLDGFGGHRDPVPALDEQEVALPPRPGSGRRAPQPLGRAAAPRLSSSWSVSLCGLAAVPHLGEGAGDVETGAGGAPGRPGSPGLHGQGHRPPRARRPARPRPR